MKIKKSYEELEEWISNRRYSGYDLYDGLNSPYFENLPESKYIRLPLIRLSVDSPINFRPLFRIRPSIGNKSLSLISRAYFRHYKATRNLGSLDKGRKILARLLKSSLINKYGNHSWHAHPYGFQLKNIYYSTNSKPCMVGNIFPILAFLEELEIDNNDSKNRLRIIEGATNYMIENLLTDYKGTIFFRYRHETPLNELNHNVNALGASILSKLYKITKREKYKEIAIQCIDTLIEYQNVNGSWHYTDIIKKRTLSKQLDYHQGFIIDSLLDFVEFIQPSNSKYFNALISGSDFYMKEQFLSDGRCKWRWPHTWPIDIHNQAQGIITFSKLSQIKPEYLKFARTIAIWTIKNMQDKSGFFYHQKGFFYKKKIAFLRWGQAWMMLALGELLNRLENDKNTVIKC